MRFLIFFLFFSFHFSFSEFLLRQFNSQTKNNSFRIQFSNFFFYVDELKYTKKAIARTIKHQYGLLGSSRSLFQSMCIILYIYIYICQRKKSIVDEFKFFSFRFSSLFIYLLSRIKNRFNHLLVILLDLNGENFNFLLFFLLNKFFLFFFLALFIFCFYCFVVVLCCV